MTAASPELRPLRLVAFPGPANWPVWAGTEHGFFAREGLTLTHTLTPNSREMARALANGEVDVALTSIDNVIAYNEGQGEAGLEPTDFVAVMGVDSGFLNLMAQPRIAQIGDLKGAKLAVDALTTGYAFVLREVLARRGLGPGEVEFVRIGSGAKRLEALLDGTCAATLLNTPLDLLAEAAGCRRLARATDVIGPIQAVVGAVRRSWASDNGDAVTAFIRAFHGALGWLADPANRASATSLLEARIKALNGAQAQRAYDILLDPGAGMHRDLAIDEAGVATVLALRSRYGEPRKELRDPALYIDGSFRRAALGRG